MEDSVDSGQMQQLQHEEAHQHHRHPRKGLHEKFHGSGSGTGTGTRFKLDDHDDDGVWDGSHVDDGDIDDGDSVDGKNQIWFSTSLKASPVFQIQQTKTDSLIQLLSRPSPAATAHHHHRYVMGQQGDAPVAQPQPQPDRFARPRNTTQSAGPAGPSSSVDSLLGSPPNRFSDRHTSSKQTPQVGSGSALGPGSSELHVKTMMSDYDDWFASMENEVVPVPVYTSVPVADQYYHGIDQQQMVAPVQQQLQHQALIIQYEENVLQQQQQQQQQQTGLALSRKQRIRSAGSSVVSLPGEPRNRFTDKRIPNKHGPQVGPELGPGSSELHVKTMMSDYDWFASLEDEVVPVYTPVPPTDP